MKKGLLIVVSGPAGSGKGTVNAKLLATGDFAFSVSATTRAPRPGEVDGVNYYYITHEEFQRRIEAGEMLEYTCYCKNYYGTPLREAEAVLESGKNLILEIEVEGAMNVKAKYPDAVLIMLLPPSFAIQEARLRGRGTESEEVISGRLAKAREEIKLASSYDYVVVNEDGKIDECAELICNIIRANRNASARMKNVTDNFLDK
jgi:guanylate kinase